MKSQNLMSDKGISLTLATRYFTSAHASASLLTGAALAAKVAIRSTIQESARICVLALMYPVQKRKIVHPRDGVFHDLLAGPIWAAKKIYSAQAQPRKIIPMSLDTVTVARYIIVILRTAPGRTGGLAAGLSSPVYGGTCGWPFFPRLRGKWRTRACA
jgi:hypothetical protein